MDQEKIKQFVEKIGKLKKEHKLDLSSDEDLSIAVMNLVSLEEHFFFTGAKTGKEKYYDLLSKVREIRKELLKKIVKDTEGEVWCISKHLLAASMRLMEVGTKQLSQGNKTEAEDLFSKAYNLYSLFWGLNLKLLNVSDMKNVEASNPSGVSATNPATIKKIGDDQLNVHDKAKGGFMGKLGDLVKKIIDCCIE